MPDVTRVILADDHKILRTGLKALIERDRGFRVAGEASDGEELLDLLTRTVCDCVVLDLSMPRMDGIHALRQIIERYPRTKVLVLTMHKDIEHYKLAMSLGASGYVLKDDAYDQLLMALKVVRNGKSFASPSIRQLLMDQTAKAHEEGAEPSLEILTHREREVLRLVSRGLANKNIAAKLKISRRTVESHRSNITRKLGIRTTAGLVKYALAKGLE